jgi:predicted nucleic-acid-binding Zn-ribbon protein
MLQIECPKCESRNGLNIMKGEVTQLMDAATKTPQIINWTCGFCGYTDSDTIYMGEMGGSQNVKSIVGEIPAPEPPPLEAASRPMSAARPKAAKAAPKPEPTPDPVVDPVVDPTA